MLLGSNFIGLDFIYISKNNEKRTNSAIKAYNLALNGSWDKLITFVDSFPRYISAGTKGSWRRRILNRFTKWKIKKGVPPKKKDAQSLEVIKNTNSINIVIGNVFIINKIGDFINLHTTTKEKTDEIWTPTIDKANEKATIAIILM